MSTHVAFTPVTLGGRESKNRLMLAPMSVGYGNPDGTVSDVEIEHYGRRAQGGIGTVFTENFAVSWAGRQMPHQTVVVEESLDGLTRLAAEIHRHDALAVVQLVHAGRYAGPWEEYDARRRLAPSAIPFDLLPGRTETPAEITPEEIEESIQEFVDASVLCHRAGFDGVDIHAAQGFLISEFLSPRMNQRTDEWGGSFDNRIRFLTEVLRRVREATPDDFTVGVHVMSDELIDGGWTLDEGVRLARVLEEGGADFLFAIPSTFETLRLPANLGMLNRPRFGLPDTEAFAKAVDIPVLANGALSTLDDVEAAIVGSGAAGVAMARPLFVDPDWPRKTRAGLENQVHRCPCDPPLCLQTQLSGAMCTSWTDDDRSRGYLGYAESVQS